MLSIKKLVQVKDIMMVDMDSNDLENVTLTPTGFKLSKKSGMASSSFYFHVVILYSGTYYT